MNRRSTLVVLFLTFAVGAEASAQQVTPQDVRDYIRNQFRSDYAYSDLTTLYDASATTTLIAMLNSAAEEAYWEKVVYALGAIGDQRAVEALIAFIEKPRSGHLSKADDDARVQAIQSLGLSVNRTGSEIALTYLIEGLTPSVWPQRNVQGLPPAMWTLSLEDYYRSFSRHAMYGLAFSGHPQAGEALRRFQTSPTPEQTEFQRSVENILPQWFGVYDVVRTRGVAGMYEFYEAQRREAARR